MMSDAGITGSIQLRRDVWTLGQRIGEGGGGAVYTATSASTSAAVAKLIVKAPGVPREMLFERLPENVRNVIPTLDSGETAEHWVLVMPRAEIALDEYLRRHEGPLPLDEAVRILTDIATALADLDGNVVHRDIKPANILRYDGAWRLADFGIARYAEVATASDTKKKALSAAYAAPEQWRGERATARTDIYAWGVIAFELLGGRWPFLGPDREEFWDQHLHAEPPTLSEGPESLAVLVEDCMGKAARTRPSAKEVLRELERLKLQTTPGQALLGRVHGVAVRERNEQSWRGSLKKSAKTEREEQYNTSLVKFRRLSDKLWFALRDVAPTTRIVRGDEPGWCLSLRGAPLRLGLPQRTGRRPWGTGPDPGLAIAAHTRIDLGVADARAAYTGRAHSLWFCDAGGDRLRWYELAFLHRGYPRRQSSHMPFALNPGVSSGAALLRDPGEVELMESPRCVEENLDDFVERWTTWFALAARGELTFPGG